jgi:putative membrane protein
MMLPAAWAVAELIVGRSGGLRGVLRFLLVSAVAFTAWDLFLDPQMVAWGYWEWSNPVGYFGIPWVNYGGWLLSAFLLGALVFLTGSPPPPMPVRPLLVIYTVTWLLQAIGLGLFWGMPGPAAVGFVAMGFFAVAAWRALRIQGRATVASR